MSHCIQVWSPDKTWRRPTDGRDPGRRPPGHGRRGKVPRQSSEAGKKFVQWHFIRGCLDKMTKTRVPYCHVRAVLHSYIFLIVFPITFILMKHRMAKIAEFSHYRSHIIGHSILSAYSSFTATLSPKLCLSFFSLT